MVFRSKFSTTHATISLTERIKDWIDKGDYVCGIFIDLEKAFDTVNHDILLDKLTYYGIRGNINNLIRSYLTNRKQYASIKGHNSGLKNVTCGVPQGSCLGPLLFLIYINDFRFCLDNTESGHFADDTYILYNSKKLKTIETVVNTELKLISKWLRLNKLSLNADKTELIIFHSKQHKLDSKIYINLDGTKLSPVDFVKYLGIFIDKHLDWGTHIHHLSLKLSRANGILSKLRHNAPREVCLKVYYAIFYSHLINGCSVWGITTETNINKIEVLQKKCARIITFSDFDAHANPLLIELKLAKFRDIVKSHHLKLSYEFCNNALPSDLNNFFEFREDIHSTNLKLKSTSKNCLALPKTNSVNSGTRSIKHQCATTWNYFMTKKIALDDKNYLDMKRVHNVHQFKRLLKKHFKYSYLSE